MRQTHNPGQQAAASGDRLSRLSEATLRINETLEFDSVMQEVVDSACALTGARYGLITTMDDDGQPEDFFTSGVTDEERVRLEATPGGMLFFDNLSRLPEPLRVPDFNGHMRSLGLPGFNPLLLNAFLMAPIRHQGRKVGFFSLAQGERGVEFSREDEETLVMFAAQAALVIANARRYRKEQRARADLETLIDTSPVGVLVFDAKTGGLTSVNREARRIVSGLHMPDGSAEELLDMLTFRRADGREISLEEFPLAQALSTGETVRAEEIVIEVPDGGSVTTLVNATPIRSQEGVVVSVVVTLQDMTPLEEMDRLRAEFLGMVSHELRAPLTSIKGSTDTLLESLHSLDPAEVAQFLRIIKFQAERMRNLISELLDVARVETGSLSVAPEPAEVTALVDEARNTFLSGGGRDNIVIDLEPDLPWVMADRRRIAQALGNLLTNAARYSQETSAIRVSAGLEDSFVAIAVADKGRGMSPEQLPFLFTKFSRSEGDGERRITNSGLGLAICKGIVEAHGGRIRAESGGLGMGAKFTFTLPVAGEIGTVPPGDAPGSSGRSRRESREQARVLAVDDDPMTLRYVREALTKAGFLPLVTTDPDEALRLVEAERPRLALLDLMLAGRDGIELISDILGMADMPVIFLSAYGRDETIARAIEAGAIDYMTKPFSPTELVARVRTALRRRLAPSSGEPSKPFVLGDLTIDYAERLVRLAGAQVHLTPIEYELLLELSVNAGRVVSFDHLLGRVWGMGHNDERGSVRTYVKRLRRKLGDNADNPKYIFAEPRIGYRMPKGETQEREET